VSAVAPAVSPTLRGAGPGEPQPVGPPPRRGPGRPPGAKSRPRSGSPERTPPPGRERRYLRLEDVERRLGLSRASAYRLVQTGAIKSVTIGRSRRVSEAELERFIDALEAAS
jgi:excisionase family DNA binding protein